MKEVGEVNYIFKMLYSLQNTGSGTNNTPFLLQNLLLQNYNHVIL